MDPAAWTIDGAHVDLRATPVRSDATVRHAARAGLADLQRDVRAAARRTRSPRVRVRVTLRLADGAEIDRAATTLLHAPVDLVGAAHRLARRAAAQVGADMSAHATVSVDAAEVQAVRALVPAPAPWRPSQTGEEALRRTAGPSDACCMDLAARAGHPDAPPALVRLALGASRLGGTVAQPLLAGRVLTWTSSGDALTVDGRAPCTDGPCGTPSVAGVVTGPPDPPRPRSAASLLRGRLVPARRPDVPPTWADASPRVVASPQAVLLRALARRGAVPGPTHTLPPTVATASVDGVRVLAWLNGQAVRVDGRLLLIDRRLDAIVDHARAGGQHVWSTDLPCILQGAGLPWRWEEDRLTTYDRDGRALDGVALGARLDAEETYDILVRQWAGHVGPAAAGGPP